MRGTVRTTDLPTHGTAHGMTRIGQITASPVVSVSITGPHGIMDGVAHIIIGIDLIVLLPGLSTETMVTGTTTDIPM